jgi:hypothetical protein
MSLKTKVEKLKFGFAILLFSGVILGLIAFILHFTNKKDCGENFSTSYDCEKFATQSPTPEGIPKDGNGKQDWINKCSTGKVSNGYHCGWNWESDIGLDACIDFGISSRCASNQCASQNCDQWKCVPARGTGKSGKDFCTNGSQCSSGFCDTFNHVCDDQNCASEGALCYGTSKSADCDKAGDCCCPNLICDEYYTCSPPP